MSDTLPSLRPITPLGSTVNKIINYAKSNTLNKSNDFLISKTTNGTTLKLSSALKPTIEPFCVYKGDYSATDAYCVNDIVRVMPDINYSGADLELVPATPGVWICVSSIPDELISEKLKSFGYTISPYVRLADVEYYPQWPEPEATVDTTGVGRYWELISLMPMQTKMCINGVDTIFYVDAMQSGSI